MIVLSVDPVRDVHVGHDAPWNLGSVLDFISFSPYYRRMARPLRLQFPGAVYHLTARGNARQDIYLDDMDRLAFVRRLGHEVQQQRWACYAYCLMSNHYHLLIETPEGNLVSGMRRLNGMYCQAFNRRHGRVGHVLQGRYTSIVVDRNPYLLELCRYTCGRAWSRLSASGPGVVIRRPWA